MTKLKILFATTAFLSFAICESAFSACPDGQTADSTPGHCIKTGSDCGGKCTYYYDTENEIIFK